MLEIIDVRKRYDSQVAALQGVSLTVNAGEIVCLLGPSGSGKSTLLRIVAGLEQPDDGRVLLEGQDLAGVPVHKRGFGLMFQDFALFPDKSVARNVAFGLRMEGWAEERIRRRVDEMLALVSLSGYGDRSIFALSGGERQRVALARSLAPSPRLLMLDEPLGSLDRTLRESLLDELRGLLKRLGLTSIYVTHDQQEALAVADRVAILDQGELVQVGAPREVHLAPATPFVARFLGLTNLLPARVEVTAPHEARTAIGSITLARVAEPGAWTLLIRPEAARLAGPGSVGADDAAHARVPVDASPVRSTTIRARVREVSFRGGYQRAETTVMGAGGNTEDLLLHLPAGAALRQGDEITLVVDPNGVTLLPREDEDLRQSKAPAGIPTGAQTSTN